MMHISTAPQSFKIRINTARDQGASDTKHLCCLPSLQMFGSILYRVRNRDGKRFRRPNFSEKASPPFAQRFGGSACSHEKVRTDTTNGGLWRPFEDAIQKASSRKIREVSSCNFQVSRTTPRSRSVFQVAIAKLQDSNHVPGQCFKLQLPSFKIQTTFQVRASRCNFQVSRFTPFSKGEFRTPLTHHVEFWSCLIPWHTGSSWLGTSATDPSVFSQNCDRFAVCCSVAACRLCIERPSLAASLLHGRARW